MESDNKLHELAAKVAGRIKYRSEFHGLDSDDIYQVAYLAVLTTWDKKPDQKEAYYFTTALGRAKDFANWLRYYDKKTKRSLKPISLTDNYPITKKVKEGIYGKQLPRSWGVDDYLPWAQELKSLHDLYKKPRCEPNCDGTCKALVEKECNENIADSQSPANCFICNKLTHNIINVRYDVIRKGESRLRASHDSSGLLLWEKINKGQLKTVGPIWKGICQDCFSEQ